MFIVIPLKVLLGTISHEMLIAPWSPVYVGVSTKGP